MKTHYIYVPKNYMDIENFLFMEDYAKTLLKKCLSKGINLYDLFSSFQHQREIIILERIIVRNDLFNVNLVWKNCMTKHNIRWEKIKIKPTHSGGSITTLNGEKKDR
jgi:hypothetical protein